MTTYNNIPKPFDQLISLGLKSLTGAVAIGAGIPLTINTAAKITTDLHALTGDPATPLVPGKLAQYAAQKAAVTQAYADGRLAVKAGRAFCLLAVDILRPVLGNKWNSRWNAAGFIAPTLTVPRDPVPMLIRFREYFNANAAQEVASLDVTAVTAQVRLAAIQQANLTIAQARDLRINLKAGRDASLKDLRKRLSGLREELGQLLPDTDGRWYDFGFRRPADGSQPAPVGELVVTAIGSGTALATWATSARALDYRVTWKPVASSDPAVEVGLFSEAQAIIPSLPSGVPIVVSVSARNASGETAATQKTATL